MSDLLSSKFKYSDFKDAGYTLTKMKAQSKFVPKFEFADTKTCVGIEVEVEQILTNNPVGAEFIYASDNTTKIDHFLLWNNKEDGSLRNNGREFVSYPVAGENIEFALHTLNKFLHYNVNAKGHEFSDRTSVHVHVDFREVKFDDVANLLLTYIAVEPVLYNFCGGRRHKNIFCVPVNQTAQYRGIRRFWQNRNYETLSFLIREWRKYLGLNLLPLGNSSHFGTIEFRHMVGTIDVERLCQWINMLLRLKKYALNTNFEANYAEVVNLNTTSEYANYVSKVLGHNVDLFFPHIQQRMEEMVLFIKSCSLPSVVQDSWTQKGVFKNFQKLFEDSNSPLLKKLKDSGLVWEAPKSKKQQKLYSGLEWGAFAAAVGGQDDVVVPVDLEAAQAADAEFPFLGEQDQDGRENTILVRGRHYRVSASKYASAQNIINHYRDTARLEFGLRRDRNFADVTHTNLQDNLEREIHRAFNGEELKPLRRWVVIKINFNRRQLAMPEYVVNL